MVKPSVRMDNLKQLFFANQGAKITQMQKSGMDVIRLDVGSPDMPPAEAIIDKLILHSKNPHEHGYQPHKGTNELRQAWVIMYQREYRVNLNPETMVLPLLGSKEGIFHLTQSVINKGDVVLIPDPGYLTYEQAALFAGGEIVKLPISDGNDYLPTLDQLDNDLLEKTKLFWINYPNNPTSAVAPRAYFEKIIQIASEYQFLVCHDAAYTQVLDDNSNAPSILSCENAIDVSIEFNSLSKSHNMAGWRSGAVLGNPAVISNLFKLKTNIDSGHFKPIIEASIEALIGDQKWRAARNEKYRQRRDVVINYLQKMGLKPVISGATLYTWCPVPEGWKSEDFVNSTLENTGVSFTPGIVFGENGEGFIRIALVQTLTRIVEAMERLQNWI